MEVAVQNAGVALPQKGLTQRRQQIGVEAQRGAADRYLVHSRVPHFFLRDSKVFGYALQRQGLRVAREGLPSDERS